MRNGLIKIQICTPMPPSPTFGANISSLLLVNGKKPATSLAAQGHDSAAINQTPNGSGGRGRTPCAGCSQS